MARKTKQERAYDLTIWEGVPIKYRHCMASGRHDLALVEKGVDGGIVLQWWACIECPCQRLTSIDPLGNRDHDYARPEDYKLPDGLTAVDKRAWLRYEAEVEDAPRVLNLDTARAVFGESRLLPENRAA